MLVVRQLSRDVIGYMKTGNVISAFRSFNRDLKIQRRDGNDNVA